MAKPKYEKWLEKENLILLEGWRCDGLTLDQIAHNMGVHIATLHKYMNDHREINDALKSGEEVSIYEVENAMKKSALGHFVEEIEIIETENELGKVVTKKKHRRYIPPSTAAQIFMLKNRRPDWWKDTRTIEAKNDGQLAALIDGLKEPESKDE